MEEKAARAYDLAALKYWGSSTHINFPVRFNRILVVDIYVIQLMPFFVPRNENAEPFWQVENYHQELEDMKNMTRQEFVAHLRRLNFNLTILKLCLWFLGFKFGF